MVKAAIFDLDGTLVNSLQDLCDSTNHALKTYGLAEHRLSEYKLFIGDGIPKLIERAISPQFYNETLKEKVYMEFMDYYRKHYADKTVPYENINEVLEKLKKSGIELAVVSNKADEMVQKLVLKLFGNTFSQVSGKKENFPLKPDPQLTLNIIEKLDVSPAECVFFGDSGMDMLTAKKCGCIAAGVLWGYRSCQELEKNGADFLLDEPKKIFDFIWSLNK